MSLSPEAQVRKRKEIAPPDLSLFPALTPQGSTSAVMCQLSARTEFALRDEFPQLSRQRSSECHQKMFVTRR